MSANGLHRDFSTAGRLAGRILQTNGKGRLVIKQTGHLPADRMDMLFMSLDESILHNPVSPVGIASAKDLSALPRHGHQDIEQVLPRHTLALAIRSETVR